MASSSDLNIFDKFCNIWPQNVTMEQIAGLALTGKVILSYKINSLNSFHDQLMKGLWKRSSNGCLYPLDNCCEKLLYVEINDNFEAEASKSLKKLRNFGVAPKVFDEMSELVLSSDQNLFTSIVVENTNGVEGGVDNKLSKPPMGSNYGIDKLQVEVIDFLEEKMGCNTAKFRNFESQVAENGSNSHFPLLDNVNEDLKCRFDCIGKFRNTHKVFDEMAEREVGVCEH